MLSKLPAESQAASAAAVEQLAGSAQLLKAAVFERCGAPGLAQTAALLRLAADVSAAGDAQERCIAYAQLATHAAQHKGFRAAVQAQTVPSPLLTPQNCVLGRAQISAKSGLPQPVFTEYDFCYLQAAWQGLDPSFIFLRIHKFTFWCAEI